VCIEAEEGKTCWMRAKGNGGKMEVESILTLGGKPNEQGKERLLLVRGGVTVRRTWWLEKGSSQGENPKTRRSATALFVLSSGYNRLV